MLRGNTGVSMASLRRLAAVAFTMLAALAVSWSAPAAAQTADEYADEWTEARRGERGWKQRVAEQVTTGLAERVVGRAPTGPMKEAHNYIDEAIEARWKATRDPCLAAALNQADSQTNATGRQDAMAGAFDMLTSALGGATSANEVRRFLGQRLFNQVREHLQNRALDQFKEEVRAALRRASPDYWTGSNNGPSCQVEYRGTWLPARERYEFIIVGDCQCNEMPCGPHLGGSARLRRWTVEGWGTIEPVIEQGPQGQKTIRWAVGRPQDLTVTAECCGRGDQRRYVLHPPQGNRNRWVDSVTQPDATPQPPRRPQTGSEPPPTGSTGRTGTTPRPSRPPRIDIPVIPEGKLTDAQLENLEQRASDAAQLAESERNNAYRAMDEARRTHGADSPEAKAAEAAHEAAAETHRRARRALDEVQRRVIEQANQEQSSLQPPPDPRMATIFAEHNRARAEVGVPPLRWDPTLAAGAAAYAAELARTGRRVHASREGRGAIRENLNQGMLGWSPRQMVDNWLKEKQNFFPGKYPDVTRTGRWQDVSHYTQMIWPTTTHVGCGLALGSGYQWLVCRYSPGGNKDGQPVGLPPNRPVIAQDGGIAPPNSATPVGPRDIPRLPVGGGMTQIDPPPPPPPTARDDAPEGDEARHPLVTYFNEAFTWHGAATDCDNATTARLELEKMRYALDQLKKRLKDARKARRLGIGAINPDDVQRQVDEMERKIRFAEQRRRGDVCPPEWRPPPPPPR